MVSRGVGAFRPDLIAWPTGMVSIWRGNQLVRVPASEAPPPPAPRAPRLEPGPRQSPPLTTLDLLEDCIEAAAAHFKLPTVQIRFHPADGSEDAVTSARARAYAAWLMSCRRTPKGKRFTSTQVAELLRYPDAFTLLRATGRNGLRWGVA